MKKQMKKLIAVILLSAFVCSAFLTGCAPQIKNEAPDDTTADSTQDTGDTTPDTPQNPGDTTPDTPQNPGDTTPDTPQNPGDTTPDTPQNPGDETTDTKYNYVVVIGVDGGGRFFKDANTPNIDRIFADGAVTYDMLVEKRTWSAPCWASLFHGVTMEYHGIQSNATAENNPYPTDSMFPSFFRVIRENNPNAILASFSHWGAINNGIVEDNINVYKVSGIEDEEIASGVCSYVASTPPEMLFVQFDDADHVGHSIGYGTPEQLLAIEEIDGYIGKIYEAYEQKGIIDDTLFIVTADHGGINKSHGGYTDAETYVMFAATGKTVEKGEIQDMEIRDTAAVVLYALGYAAPDTWTARVPSGLFEGVTAGRRPIYMDKNSERYHESEPTPTVDSDKYITNYITDHELKTYLTFDGNINDTCNGNITQSGEISFEDGYFGQGIALGDGYVSINDYTPSTDSFTVALWIRTDGDSSDPCIISNKNWQGERNAGYALSLNKNKNVRFNAGDGINCLDVQSTLPSNFREGWMHIILIVDRDTNKISICYDFGVLTTGDIPAAMQDKTFNALSSLNIGQDGTGDYSAGLPAIVDEFMIFDGAFDRADINELSKYFGKPNTTAELREHHSETPEKDGEGYVTNFITDKELQTYLTFDGNVNDSTEKSTVTANGTVSYEDGYYGQGIKLDSGYVSIADFVPANQSFSAAFWIKTNGVTGDPSIISNKNWSGGRNKGFMVALQDDNRIKLNFGDGTNRTDVFYELPSDYKTGWVYVVYVFDRDNGEFRLSFDFHEFRVFELPDAIVNASANGYADVLNIGQDGTGNYGNPLTASIDEFMLFNGALDNDDIKALAEYCGVEAN